MPQTERPLGLTCVDHIVAKIRANVYTRFHGCFYISIAVLKNSFDTVTRLVRINDNSDCILSWSFAVVLLFYESLKSRYCI
jgi:hypothetical protein